MPRKSLILGSLIVFLLLFAGFSLSSRAAAAGGAAPASATAAISAAAAAESASASGGAEALGPQEDRHKDTKARRGGQADQLSHLQRGAARFERGFYELLPKNRKAEAEVEFAAAAREYELALAEEPLSREAHRGLARVFYIRKNYVDAAAHYRRLTEIDPFDIDSYALAALALGESGRLAEARTELEKARLRTADPHALTMLDGFLRKLDEAEKQGLDGKPDAEKEREPAAKEGTDGAAGGGKQAPPRKRAAADSPAPAGGGR